MKYAPSKTKYSHANYKMWSHSRDPLTIDRKKTYDQYMTLYI